MPKVVVLLFCDEDCRQAGLIGKAILGGYPGQIFVYGYNYRKRTLHVFNPPRMRTEALNVALIGQVTPTGSPDHNIWFDVANHFGVAPTQIPIARITQAQLNKVAGFAQLNQGMTTLAPSKVDKFSHGDWLSHATQQLDSVELAVRARHPKATVCFCIAPNPRNAPLRLQTFGHKLTWDGVHQRVAYSRKGGGTFNINDFAEQQLDLIAAFAAPSSGRVAGVFSAIVMEHRSCGCPSEAASPPSSVTLVSGTRTASLRSLVSISRTST